MDITAEADDGAQAESPEENVRIIMPPLSFGAVVPDIPTRPKPVVLLLQQMGWSVQAQLTPNNALDLSRRLKLAAKQANSGIVLPPGVQAMPGAVDLSELADDDEPEAVAE